jgi:PTS system N-acetylglucosamine-specific IIC component
MFVAPSLYVIHALLTGLSLAVTYSLGVLDAGAFSPGFIDYVLSWGLATKPWLIIPIGIGIGAVYYVVFSWMIRHFDIPTVGRYDEGIEANVDAEKRSDFSKQILAALGGTANLAEVSNCITRLRIVVSDSAKVDQQALKSIPGVKGVISKDKAVQVVIGLQAEHIANEIKEEIKR